MQIVHDYRTLHTIPELDWELPKTTYYIQKQLSSLRCKVFSPVRDSVCAFFDYGKSDCIAFRADTDGLPIGEQTDLPWQSRHPGKMHACGHDGHTAIVLELARKLNRTENLPCNVLLIFQPAEETNGGAQSICQTGILSQYKVRAIFGLHLWPGLPKGEFFSRRGTLMSRSAGVSVMFTGKSVHIAHAGKGADALCACCDFLLRAEKLQFPFPFRLKFGKLSGGTAENIICDRAELLGSMRSLSERNHENLKSALSQFSVQIGKKYGCDSRITFSAGYPAVWNHPALWNQVQKNCSAKQLCRTFWTADDFSFYQKEIPGLYFLLGLGDTPPLHSPNFAFDEALLSSGADFFLHLCKQNVNWNLSY